MTPIEFYVSFGILIGAMVVLAFLLEYEQRPNNKRRNRNRRNRNRRNRNRKSVARRRGRN